VKDVNKVEETYLENMQLQRKLVTATVIRQRASQKTWRGLAWVSSKEYGAKLGTWTLDTSKDVVNGVKEWWSRLDIGQEVGRFGGYVRSAAAQYKTIGFAIDNRDDINKDTILDPSRRAALMAKYSAATSDTSMRSPFRFATGGKFSIMQLGFVGMKAFSNAKAKAEWAPPRIGPFAEHGHPGRDVGTNDYFDRTAASTFTDAHERQHGWAQIGWAQVAMSATSQIYSPFAIDRAADTRTILASSRMVTGQVAQFNARSIAGFAAQSVGRVGTNAVPMPILFLDPALPSARA